VDEFEFYIVEKHLCAIAEASAYVIATPDFCLAAGIVYAGVSECQAPAPY
jgi:hypothetical protein